jgi:hypothetical protein
MVPLAEAWDSGARTWTTAVRHVYANDLGDSRTLVGVRDSVNQPDGDQGIAEWNPTYDKCRHLRAWVAVKHRWRLSVDSTEKSAMSSLAATAPAPRSPRPWLAYRPANRPQPGLLDRFSTGGSNLAPIVGADP